MLIGMFHDLFFLCRIANDGIERMLRFSNLHAVSQSPGKTSLWKSGISCSDVSSALHARAVHRDDNHT